MNEILWILTVIVDFLLVVLSYRYLGKFGLLILIPILTIIANIQVTKVVLLCGHEATLGNAAYASLFLATDILSENHGKRAAMMSVFLGFGAMLVTLLLMAMSIKFIPAPSDLSQKSLITIFGFLPRLVLASLVAFITSQTLDVAIFNKLKSLDRTGRLLWLRNNFATTASQLLDTLIFTNIAFWGIYSHNTLLSINITTFALKFLAAILDTPFLYLAKYLHSKGEIPDEILP